MFVLQQLENRTTTRVERTKRMIRQGDKCDLTETPVRSVGALLTEPVDQWLRKIRGPLSKAGRLSDIPLLGLAV